MAFLDEVGVAELWSLVKAKDSENAKIVTGSYAGEGKFGSGNPNSLTFPFVPKVVFIAVTKDTNAGYYAWFGMLTEDYGSAIGNEHNDSIGTGVVTQTIAEWGTTIKWYSDYPGWQFDSNICTYHYVAIG